MERWLIIITIVACLALVALLIGIDFSYEAGNLLCGAS